jgi:hypothetical protein
LRAFYKAFPEFAKNDLYIRCDKTCMCVCVCVCARARGYKRIPLVQQTVLIMSQLTALLASTLAFPLTRIAALTAFLCFYVSLARSGESYAGQYVPNIANYILDNMEAELPLKGILVGNGCWGGDANNVDCNGPNSEQNDVDMCVVTHPSVCERPCVCKLRSCCSLIF